MSLLSKRFSLLFYLKKQKNYVSGNQPIYLRITVDEIRTEISSKRNCDPQKWNSSAGRAKGTKEDIKALNAFLDLLQSKVYQVQYDLVAAGKHVTGELIKNSLAGVEETQHTLIDVVVDHNLTVEKLIGKGYAKATWTKYETTLNIYANS